MAGCLMSKQHASVSWGEVGREDLLAGCLTSQQHTSVSWGGVGRGDLLAGCLTSQQHASISRGRICLVAWCCNTKIEVVNQPFHLAQSNNILTLGQPVPQLTL